MKLQRETNTKINKTNICEKKLERFNDNIIKDHDVTELVELKYYIKLHYEILKNL